LLRRPPIKFDEIDAKIREVSEEPLYIEVFDARCPDASESNSVENEKNFNEDLLKCNVKNLTTLSSHAMCMGIKSMVALIQLHLKPQFTQKVETG
jgi:hypothetical protein